MGDGGAEGSSAMGDGGQAAVSLKPDINVRNSSAMFRTPLLNARSPDVNSKLIGKVPDAGED